MTSIQKLLRKARKGARVIYVPGNHDEFAREYTGLNFGGVEVVDHALHETADGKTMLVIHGDQFDIVVRNARWLAFFGDWAYDFAHRRQHLVQPCAPHVRRRLLVAFRLGEAEGQERRQLHRRFRERARVRGRPAQRRRRRSAAISITRRSRRSAASSTSIPATLSKAAPRSPSMTMARLRSCGGTRRRPNATRRTLPSAPRPCRTRERRRLDANFGCDGRLASAGQWRRPIARDHGAVGARAGRRRSTF